MKDISQSPAYRGACCCPIHEISFAIDEECPICIEQEDCEIAAPYQEHIKQLNMQMYRLRTELMELKKVKK